MRILYIEDSPLQTEIVANAAQRFGCEVTNVRTITEGLDLLKQEWFDVVVIDPGTSDSSTTTNFGPARRLALLCQAMSVPACFYSASDDIRHYKNGTPWFIKPSQLDELLCWITKHAQAV